MNLKPILTTSLLKAFYWALLGAVIAAFVGALLGALYPLFSGQTYSFVFFSLAIIGFEAILGAILGTLFWSVRGALFGALVGAVIGTQSLVGFAAHVRENPLIKELAFSGAVDGVFSGILLGFFFGLFIGILMEARILLKDKNTALTMTQTFFDTFVKSKAKNALNEIQGTHNTLSPSINDTRAGAFIGGSLGAFGGALGAIIIADHIGPKITSFVDTFIAVIVCGIVIGGIVGALLMALVGTHKGARYAARVAIRGVIISVAIFVFFFVGFFLYYLISASSMVVPGSSLMDGVLTDMQGAFRYARSLSPFISLFFIIILIFGAAYKFIRELPKGVSDAKMQTKPKGEVGESEINSSKEQ